MLSDGTSLNSASSFVLMVICLTISVPMILPMSRSSVSMSPEILIGLSSEMTLSTLTLAARLPIRDEILASASKLFSSPSTLPSNEKSIPFANPLRSSSPSGIHSLRNLPSPSTVMRLLLMVALSLVFSMSGMPVIVPVTVPEKPPSWVATRRRLMLKLSTYPETFPSRLALSLFPSSCGAK